MYYQPTNQVVPLNTKYKDRLEVKAAGAKWNPESKFWTIDVISVYNKPGFWLPHVDFDQLYSQAQASVDTKLVAHMESAAAGTI